MKDKEQQYIQAYDENADALFRYAFFKVSDRELAKDLVQDAFTKTWSYIAKGGQVDSVKSFLYRTLSNLVIDHYRRHHSVSLDTMAEEGFDPGFDDSDRMIDTIDGKQAIKLLDKLPEKYREAVFLRYVEELTLEEIAETTGLSKNAITVRVHRGIEKLKEIFEEEQHETQH